MNDEQLTAARELCAMVRNMVHAATLGGNVVRLPVIDQQIAVEYCVAIESYLG